MIPEELWWKEAINEMLTEHDIEQLFTYHKPGEGQEAAYNAINGAAKELARVILAVTPQCGSQVVAIRRVWEARMVANGAIATKGIF